MFLKRAVIQFFRKIQHLVIEIDGNHLVVTGPNGVGKTTVFETLLTVLGGKKYLMPDAVSRGEEEASISWEISEAKGTPTIYKAAGKIKGNDLRLAVSAFTPQGLELDVKKKPQEFLEKLAPKDFIDPVSFTRKTGKERIEMLYKLMPGLQGAINLLNSEYEAEQFKRTQINIDTKRLEGELLNTPFTEGLPAVEEDAAVLVAELQAAQSHNLGKKRLEDALVAHDESIKNSSEAGAEALEEIAALEKQLADKRAFVSAMEEAVIRESAAKSESEKELEAFVPKNVDEINARIANMSATNKAIEKNRKHVELKAQIEAKRTEFSNGLARMNEINQKKIDVYKKSKMPVEGLAVGDTDIMYPDPTTGEAMPFDRLSTGQQCRAAVEILSPFLPKAEEGLRCMLIANAESLDENNYMALLEAAEIHNVQYCIHRTTWSAADQKLEIVIEERN
jgi:energy-coupling factor transporter ATP-binding protein EcfA2